MHCFIKHNIIPCNCIHFHKIYKLRKQGPFDAIRKVFEPSSASKMTYNDKAELFFCDYSLMPLFVQENYPHVKPVKAKYAIYEIKIINQM